MNAATRAMVLGWLADHKGDAEAVARFMSKTLRIGGLRSCRALVVAVQAHEVERIFGGAK